MKLQFINIRFENVYKWLFCVWKLHGHYLFSVPGKGKYISPELAWLVRSESRDAIHKRGFSSTLVAWFLCKICYHLSIQTMYTVHNVIDNKILVSMLIYFSINPSLDQKVFLRNLYVHSRQSAEQNLYRGCFNLVL